MLANGLRELGANIRDVLTAPARVRHYLPDCELWRIGFKSNEFLVSAGCSESVHAGTAKHEFVIGWQGGNDEYFVRLMEYVVYFHASLRHIQLGECLEIGDTGIGGDFTHILTSVPYFFPPEMNFIRVEEFTYYLIWLMPIRAPEAAFVQQHGVDAFEARLDASQYGYFEDRQDLSYLQVS